MAITVPAAGTELSVSTFGAPVANAINAATPTAWVGVPFINAYGNQSGAYHPTQYRKIGDMVQVVGVVSGPANAGSSFSFAFTLPAGFRPTAQIYAFMASWNNPTWQLGRASILADGSVSLEFHQGQYIALNFQFPTT